MDHVHEEEDVRGRRLQTAVERILADDTKLIARSNEAMKAAKALRLGDEDATIAAAAAEIVKSSANRSALAGGVTALPALVPGIGSIIAATGGALADMALVLKVEVEMALVLTHLHGFDITDEHERKLAFLLASISTWEAKSDGNALKDLARIENAAFWTYGPREASKLVALVFARLALLAASKGLVRALPVVGIAVGTSVNRVLTNRVGERCTRELVRRRRTFLSEKRAYDAGIVDAKVAP